MKIKGLINKINRVNPNTVLCSMEIFGLLKKGKIATLTKEEAEQLLNMGVVEKVKTSKKGDK
mgnify:CR=1 FL=1